MRNWDEIESQENDEPGKKVLLFDRSKREVERRKAEQRKKDLVERRKKRRLEAKRKREEAEKQTNAGQYERPRMQQNNSNVNRQKQKPMMFGYNKSQKKEDYFTNNNWKKASSNSWNDVRTSKFDKFGNFGRSDVRDTRNNLSRGWKGDAGREYGRFQYDDNHRKKNSVEGENSAPASGIKNNFINNYYLNYSFDKEYDNRADKQDDNKFGKFGKFEKYRKQGPQVNYPVSKKKNDITTTKYGRGSKAGDWYCLKCNNRNWGWREECHKCRTRKGHGDRRERKKSRSGKRKRSRFDMAPKRKKVVEKEEEDYDPFKESSEEGSELYDPFKESEEEKKEDSDSELYDPFKPASDSDPFKKEACKEEGGKKLEGGLSFLNKSKGTPYLPSKATIPNEKETKTFNLPGFGFTNQQDFISPENAVTKKLQNTNNTDSLLNADGALSKEFAKNSAHNFVKRNVNLPGTLPSNSLLNADGALSKEFAKKSAHNFVKRNVNLPGSKASNPSNTLLSADGSLTKEFGDKTEKFVVKGMDDSLLSNDGVLSAQFGEKTAECFVNGNVNLPNVE